MKILVAAIFLLSCAAPAPVVKTRQRWPTSMVARVSAICVAAVIPDVKWCACFTEELERRTPDPAVQETYEDKKAAALACGVPEAAQQPTDAI